MLCVDYSKFNQRKKLAVEKIPVEKKTSKNIQAVVRVK